MCKSVFWDETDSMNAKNYLESHKIFGPGSSVDYFTGKEPAPNNKLYVISVEKMLTIEQVKQMSQEEVHKNYEKIRKSMSKWAYK